MQANPKTRDMLKKKLIQSQSEYDKIIIGYAFMKSCYINFSQDEYLPN
jgi:hypothetical protein